MAYVKSTYESYGNASDAVNALNYICDLNKCKNNIYGGRNMIAITDISFSHKSSSSTIPASTNFVYSISKFVLDYFIFMLLVCSLV